MAVLNVIVWCIKINSNKSIMNQDKQSLYQAFIGKKNQSLYLKQWLLWDTSTTTFKCVWHWGAFFCTFYWLIYRKMWRYALIYSVVLLMIIVTTLLFGYHMGWFFYQTDYLLKLMLIFVMWVVMPCIAHFLYDHHAKNSIEVLEKASLSFDQKLQQLQKVGGTLSIFQMFLVIVVSLLFLMGNISVLYPVYQSSLIKSQLEKVQPFIIQLQQQVEQASKLSEINQLEKINRELPPKIQSLKIGAQGDIQIYFQAEFGHQAVILYIPEKQKGKILAWHCKAYNANVLMLPKVCLKSRVN